MRRLSHNSDNNMPALVVAVAADRVEAEAEDAAADRVAAAGRAERALRSVLRECRKIKFTAVR